MKKIVLFALTAAVMSCTSKEDRQIEEQRDSLQVAIDNLRVENDSLIKENRKYTFQTTVSKREIADALRNRPELIPMEPVLGGTMRFGNIKIIDEGLIVADYNDGHVEGTAIYRYKQNGEKLSFEILYKLQQ